MWTSPVSRIMQVFGYYYLFTHLILVKYCCFPLHKGQVLRLSWSLLHSLAAGLRSCALEGPCQSDIWGSALVKITVGTTGRLWAGEGAEAVTNSLFFNSSVWKKKKME